MDFKKFDIKKFDVKKFDLKKINFKDKKLWIGVVVVLIGAWMLFGGSKTVSVAKAMSDNNQRVWFVLGNEQPTEESTVEYVLVSKGGKVTAYDPDDAKLTDFKNLSDDKVIGTATDLDLKNQPNGMMGNGLVLSADAQEANDVKFKANFNEDTKKLESEDVEGVKNKNMGSSSVDLDNLVPQEKSVKLIGNEYALFVTSHGYSLITAGSGATLDDPKSKLFETAE